MRNRKPAASQVSRRHAKKEYAGFPIVPFFTFVFVSISVSGLFYWLTSAPTSREGEFAHLDVFERDLVTIQSSRMKILTHHAVTGPMHQRRLNSTTLAFVTPWNVLGYKMTAAFPHKFTHVSPTWFDVNLTDSKLQRAFFIQGDHNVQLNAEWIRNVSTSGVAIVPRYQIVSVGRQTFGEVFLADPGSDAQLQLIGAIVDHVRQNNWTGLVLEWGFIPLTSEPKLAIAVEFILSSISSAMHSDTPRRQVFLASAVGDSFLDSALLDMFAPLVDGIALMTYDHWRVTKTVGANAPAPWIEEVIVRLLSGSANPTVGRKLLMGLNFYGTAFSKSSGGAEPIIGKDYLAYLAKYGELTLDWEPQTWEHRISPVSGSDLAVYYPTLMSINARLDLAGKLGVGGVSIWEAGQGLDYFFDLL